MNSNDPQFGDVYIPSSSKLQQAAHLLVLGYRQLQESKRVLLDNGSLKITLPPEAPAVEVRPTEPQPTANEAPEVAPPEQPARKRGRPRKHPQPAPVAVPVEETPVRQDPTTPESYTVNTATFTYSVEPMTWGA